MCGIAGILSSQQAIEKHDVQKMVDAVAHRGPDGEGIWQNEKQNVCLGHRRLSIIDLSDAASQPMHLFNRYSIVHNGELYNYIELREQLIALGFNFHTTSDTEVILLSYHHWKEDCLSLFNGMFAFAIWDEQEQKLFAARDRFGEKPFYYSFNQQERKFYFASEIKALWAYGFPKIVDESILLNYITLGISINSAHPSHTFFKGIYKLEAAHQLTLNLDGGQFKLQTKSYWDIDKETINTIDETQAVQGFQTLFFGSVHKRLRSDVAIGTSLSGGLDSSSIVAAIHKLKQSSSVQKAFTATFAGFDKDESQQASLVAHHFKLQHHLVNVNVTQFNNDIDSFLQHHDEPVSSASVYAQYKVYQLASQHGVKVLLDGQGADELLAGYHKYIHWYLQELYAQKKYDLLEKEIKAFQSNNILFDWSWKNKLSAKLPQHTADHLKKRAVNALTKNEFINKDFLHQFTQKNSIEKPVVRKLNDILYHDTCTLGLEELLRNADRNSMAFGVEVRLPFLDHELAQYIFSLPSQMKMHNGFTKYMLRQSMNTLLPSSITWRTDKVGFEPPQHQWMQDKHLQERIHIAKEVMVKEKILDAKVLTTSIQPQDAYSANNFDWRYLSAAVVL